MTRSADTYAGRCRYILSDIDCTFLNTKKELLPENLKAVQAALNAGIHFAFATGRYWPAVREWVDSMGVKDIQVLDNGATIYDPVQRKALDRFIIPPDTCRFFTEGLRDAGFCPVLALAEEYFCVNQDEDSRVCALLHNEPCTQVPDYDELLGKYGSLSAKVFVYATTRIPEIEAVAETLSTQARAKGLPFNGVFTERGIFVVSAQGVNKMVGIERLSQLTGIPTSEMVAIGDGYNDVEMLRGCGLGFCMSNGTEEAKAAATHIVGSCDEAGFAQAVYQLL